GRAGGARPQAAAEAPGASPGPAGEVGAPAATPTPHAIIGRPGNRRSGRPPERAADFTAAACLATDAPAPWQAAAATASPALTPLQARPNRLLGGSGGSVGTSAGLPGASSVRAAATRSGLLTTSVRTAWRVSRTAAPTAWRTARSTAPSTAVATAPWSASAKPSKMESRRSNWLASVRRTWPFVVVVVMTIYSLK